MTEVQDFRQYYAKEDTWNVPLQDLRKSAGRGCPTCQIHLQAVMQDPEEQSQVADTQEVAISFLYLAKDYAGRNLAARNLRDINVLSISGQPFEIFTYPGI